MNHGIPEDIRWLIEVKVRLSDESSNSFISYMPGTGKSTFAKKHRVFIICKSSWSGTS
jgi:predicted PilT family ATPase